MAPRSLARPADRHEVVEQPPELALDVDVAVGAPDQPEPAIRGEPRPDPPAREVEGDGDAEDERQEGQPDEPWPGSALAMSRVYSPKPARPTDSPSSSDTLVSPTCSSTGAKFSGMGIAVGVRRRRPGRAAR